MAATLLPNGKQQFIDKNGVPLVRGLVYFYEEGTATPKATWQDPSETIPNTNPVVLDEKGQALIYGTGAYRQVVLRADSTPIWDESTASAGGITGPATTVVGDLVLWDSTNGTAVKDTGLNVVNSIISRGSGADPDVRQIQWNMEDRDMIKFNQPSTVGHEYSHSLFVTRVADYTGGTPGFVNSGLFVRDTVGVNTTSFEWAITGSVQNSSNAGENVGVYGQGWAITSTTGPTWGMVAEAQDRSNTDRANSLVGLEVDCFASGTNANRNRIGINVVSGKSSAVGATTSECWAGLYFTGLASGGGTNGYYHNVIHIGNDPLSGLTPMTVTNAIRSDVDGTTFINDTGSWTNGIFMGGSYSAYAISIPANTYLAWENTSAIKTKYNSTSNNIEFYNGSTNLYNISTTSTPYVLGALVVQTGAQSITSSTATALTWGSAQYNNHTMWAIGNPTRLTVPAGVTYVKLHGNVRYESVTSNNAGFDFFLRKNGSSSFYGVPRTLSVGGANATNYEQNLSTGILNVTPGDYFELFVNQGTAGALNTDYTANPYATWFSMEIVQ